MPLRNQPKSLGGLPIQIDYTARDYEGIRNELLNLATQLTPEWTDRQPGDIGVTLIEAVSYIADILSYQLDRVQNESYLATAQTRESVVNILRLIGYELKPASPATVNMVIETSQNNVILDANFKVFTDSTEQLDSLEYTLSQPVTLATPGIYCVGSEAARVQRIEGVVPTVKDELIFTAGRRVQETFSSNGTASQTFLLGQSPVCIDSEGITVNVGGVTYEGRTSFLGTESTDNVFIYKFLSTEEAIIIFGDGINGSIPPDNVQITVSYRIEGGEETNRAGVNTIDNFENVAGVVRVFNISQPSGGADPESLATAKKNAPLSLRALDRCVTLEDFESMAKQTPGVGIRTARAVKGDSPLEVELYVATEGANPVPSGEWFPELQNGYGDIGAVGRFLNTKKPVPTRLSIYAPTAVNPFFQATVYVHHNLRSDTVKADVDIALQSLFNQITDDFGEGIPLSAILQTIENSRGVDYVNAEAFHRLPEMRWLQGNRDSFDGAGLTIDGLNEQTIRQKYQIEWLNQSTYHLRAIDKDILVKDLNGVVNTFNEGAVSLVSFFNDNQLDTEPNQEEQFSIKIDAGTNTPALGDIWEFSVDDYLGNIESEPHEIVVSPIGNDGRLNSDQIVLTYEGGI